MFSNVDIEGDTRDLTQYLFILALQAPDYKYIVIAASAKTDVLLVKKIPFLMAELE